MKKYVLMLPIIMAALLLQAAQLNVVGEVFSTVCTGCGGDYSVARSALIQLSEEYPYIIPVIWNLTDETSPGSVGRFEWYEGSEDPHAVWSGIDHYVGDYDVINTYYDMYMELVDVLPPMKVATTMDLDGGRDSYVTINANVELYDDLSTTDNRIFFLLTYHDLTNYHGVVKLKSDEYTFEQTQGGDIADYYHTFALDPEWDLDRIRGVVIVQDWASKQILQAGEAELILPTDDEDIAPATTASVAVFPNPFNPETTISFEVADQDRNSPVSVNIYNVRGQKVRSLYHGIPSAIKTNLTWNGTDDNGRNVGSGVYYTVVLARSRTPLVKKMILLK